MEKPQVIWSPMPGTWGRLLLGHAFPFVRLLSAEPVDQRRGPDLQLGMEPLRWQGQGEESYQSTLQQTVAM